MDKATFLTQRRVAYKRATHDLYLRLKDATFEAIDDARITHKQTIRSAHPNWALAMTVSTRAKVHTLLLVCLKQMRNFEIPPQAPRLFRLIRIYIGQLQRIQNPTDFYQNMLRQMRASLNWLSVLNAHS